MASFVSGGGGGIQQHIFTGTCETAAATAAKVVTLDDSSGFSLAAGVRVAVTFTSGNTATTPTLNVSSSGAKNIVYNSSATAYTSGVGTTYNSWGAYETVIFTYTGTYWTHAFSSWGAINTLMKKDIDYVTAGKKSGTTLGTKATAEGYNTTASGDYAHAEGATTTVSGSTSHAEGSNTIASGNISHVEGSNSVASGNCSHAEGFSTGAGGNYSHTEGYYTNATRKSQHVFGEYNVSDTGGTDGTTRGTYVEIVGNGTSGADLSNARTLDWSGNEVLAGKLTVGAAPTNNMDVATKQYVDNATSGIDLSGYMQKGVDYVTAGKKSGTTLGTKSTAEGNNTTASGNYAHAEGNSSATGNYSHAEGLSTIASGDTAHTEGSSTTASGLGSHAEGSSTTASGAYSHAEGGSVTASGYYSHAEGFGTTAQRQYQHVFGKYNLPDTQGTQTSGIGKFVEIVGNGGGANNLSNARTLDWYGNETIAGKLTLGADPTANMDAVTKQYVDTKFTYGDTDLTAGTSTLAEGVFYAYYE